MSDRAVIVARWNEDVSWLSDLPSGWRPEVVQKDRDLPNTGREASSYCWWVSRNRDRIDPAGTYAFLQGSPYEPHGFRPPHLVEVDGFAPLGRDVVTERFADGWIEGRNLGPEWAHAAAGAWRAWVSRTERPPEYNSFVIGAQFLVPGRALLARPDGWWRAYGSWCCYGHRPWIAERIWRYVMDAERYP